MVGRVMRMQRGGIVRKVLAAGGSVTEHFAGFALTGHLDEARLLDLLDRLPEGTTELMCHPGFLREDLRSSRTRLLESREIELRALTSPAVAQRVRARGIVLTNYLA
jgi:predicted glycoside hydrolase/deacetylase ChbG (UPF0249 family)